MGKVKGWSIAWAMAVTPLWGTITNVRVLGTSSTQAIIGYTAPDGGACTVEVSESPSYTPLVHDVDPALYSFSNLDNRTGSISQGRSRVFVIGQRSAPRADADPKKWRYSRALQLLTPHYFRITCGSDVATGTFQTSNLPTGGTFVDTVPVDPAEPGGDAYPTLDWTPRHRLPGYKTQQKIIEPTSGLPVWRVTLKDDQFYWLFTATPPDPTTMVARQFDGGSDWSASSGAIINALASDDTVYARTTDTQQKWLELLFMGYFTWGVAPANGPTYEDDSISYDSFTVKIKASCTGTGCSAPMDVCLTVDGVNCNTVVLTQTVNQTEAVYMFPPAPDSDGDGVSAWWKPGEPRPINRQDVWTRRGNVQVTGNVVTWVSGDPFSTERWVAGSKIRIGTLDGSATQYINLPEYTIASVQNVHKLTLVSGPPDGSYTFNAPNFAVLIRKGNTSNTELKVQYLTHEARGSTAQAWNSGPGKPRCGPDPITERATGKQFYPCELISQLYLINKDDPGDIRYFGFLWVNPVGTGADQSSVGECTMETYNIIGSNPPTAYCVRDGTVAKRMLVRAKMYFNDTLDSLRQNEAVINGKLNVCDAADGVSSTNKPCWVLDNLTLPSQGKDIDSLIHNFTLNNPDPRTNAVYDNNRWLSHAVGIQNHYMIMASNAQDVAGWLSVYDLDKDPQVENPIIAATKAYDYECAWCKLHFTMPVQGSDKWIFISSTPGHYFPPLTPEQTPYNGPWESKIVKGCARCTGPNMPADASADDGCPASPLVPTGTQMCTDITIDSEPHVWFPNPGSNGETQLPGKTQLEVGEYVSFNWWCNEDEFGRIVAKNGLTLKVARGWPNYRHTMQAHGAACGPSGYNGPVLIAFCGAELSPNRPYEMGIELLTPIWDFKSNPHGNNFEIVGRTTGHASGNVLGYLGGGIDTNCPLTHCVGRYDSFDVAPATGDFAQTTTTNPPTMGKLMNQEWEEYPTFEQFKVTGNEARWMMETRRDAGFRPFRDPDGQLVTGSLYRAAKGVDTVARETPIIRHPKSAPFVFFEGNKPMQEKSGPGSVLGSGPADNYKYCYAYRIGECQPGSQVGDFYINAPRAIYPSLAGSSNTTPGLHFAEWMAAQQGLGQMGFLKPTDPFGATFRQFGHGFQHHHTTQQMTTLAARGEFFSFRTQFANFMSDNTFVAKMPPFPEQQSTNRGVFVPVNVHLTPPPNRGITNAIIKFGYREYGLPAQYYCSQRSEACIANTDQMIGNSQDADPQNNMPGWTLSGATGAEVSVNLPNHRFAEDSSVNICCIISGNTGALGNWRVHIVDKDNFTLVGSSSNGQTGQANGNLSGYQIPFDSPYFYESSDSFTVIDATNTSPVEIRTPYMHKLSAGARIRISGVNGNAAANGTFLVKQVTGAGAFTIQTESGVDVAGNGVYASGGSGDWAGMPCANGCNIAVPGISQRVLYYQVVYRNAANQVVATGPQQVTVVP